MPPKTSVMVFLFVFLGHGQKIKYIVLFRIVYGIQWIHHGTQFFLIMLPDGCHDVNSNFPLFFFFFQLKLIMPRTDPNVVHSSLKEANDHVSTSSMVGATLEVGTINWTNFLPLFFPYKIPFENTNDHSSKWYKKKWNWKWDASIYLNKMIV